MPLEQLRHSLLEAQSVLLGVLYAVTPEPLATLPPHGRLQPLGGGTMVVQEPYGYEPESEPLLHARHSLLAAQSVLLGVLYAVAPEPSLTVPPQGREQLVGVAATLLHEPKP